MHPQYNDDTLGYDAMIVHLTGPVTGRTPILLAASGSSFSLGESMIGSGWGTISLNGQRSDKLREVEMPIAEGCSSIENFQSDIMLCAGKSGSNICYDDAGGPLLHLRSNRQYGITSFTFNCDDVPSSFTRIPNLTVHNWIMITLSPFPSPSPSLSPSSSPSLSPPLVSPPVEDGGTPLAPGPLQPPLSNSPKPPDGSAEPSLDLDDTDPVPAQSPAGGESVVSTALVAGATVGGISLVSFATVCTIWCRKRKALVTKASLGTAMFEIDSSFFMKATDNKQCAEKLGSSEEKKTAHIKPGSIHLKTGVAILDACLKFS
mmetsp:Transcript_9715/g.58931  ORF Transcript_9715/g.58931 Transcript_9715/m.58931 type:complete len:318 (+) Transcript_9715:1681-2634(+)